ncbi:109aa long hypothetical protein [Pyrococcus horikoshii OT3]|uniref:Uncharacterized protein n=1 Tax=Pyrococcus horikoshii (strain ATCC 700860 / DSM 12428 / JCM 9974 / NBRC 100139 / OT-3) TaxID=70601 RepID=O59030_PYRHO|nr:109aa long hypothetical protein [Pyrococcus horikoshii OT3]
MSTSASLRASWGPPSMFSPFVFLSSHPLYGNNFSKSRSLVRILGFPLTSSTTLTFSGLTPASVSILSVANPAAPAPNNASVISLIFFPTTLRAFKSPARTTAAVPCWSS